MISIIQFANHEYGKIILTQLMAFILAWRIMKYLRACNGNIRLETSLAAMKSFVIKRKPLSFFSGDSEFKGLLIYSEFVIS